MAIKKLQGQKIYLSTVDEADYEQFAEFMADPETSVLTSTFSSVFSVEDERDYFSEHNKSKLSFAIRHNLNDELMGLVEFMNIDHISRRAELGINLGKHKYRNQGYGREAIELMLDFGFGSLNFNSIYLTVLENNARAQHLYRSIGFKDAGRLRQHTYAGGAYLDHLYMDILREEYEFKDLQNITKYLEKGSSES